MCFARFMPKKCPGKFREHKMENIKIELIKYILL